MARPKVRWEFNVAGFAALRNDPTLVSAMESSATAATAGTPYEVAVVVWPHQGRRSGPRTSVQIWADSPYARRQVNTDPGTLTETLGRVRL